jgi:hypothetical protein
MTQAERDVIEAARAAVVVKLGSRVVAGDIVSDPEKLAALVRAVMRLETERERAGYWR